MQVQAEYLRVYALSYQESGEVRDRLRRRQSTGTPGRFPPARSIARPCPCPASIAGSSDGPRESAAQPGRGVSGLDHPAVFFCAQGRCSLPVFKPGELDALAARLGQASGPMRASPR
jgi:hypothetical protein